MRETWYVLEDGSFADPADVAPDESGHLVHVDGVRVRLNGDVYASRSVDAAEREVAHAARAPKKPEGADGGAKGDDATPAKRARTSKTG